MSLIERAVSRLPGAQPPPPSAPEGAQAPADAQPRQSSIERLMDRTERLVPVGEAATPPRGVTGPGCIAPVAIDLDDLTRRGFATPGVENSRLAHELRVVKRPLVRNAFGGGAAPIRNGKRVMVTSAFPGEGKTFTAINLAMSIAAERDYQVLLVDADVARASVLRELGIKADAGLMDLLLESQLEVTDLVLPTNVDKLSILPSGRRHPQATELLASAAMSRLLEQISARYPDRMVIFDSPPVLLTTESRVLASYMGQIVMVVEASKTPRDAVKEALGAIDGSEVVGIILNKTPIRGRSGYGGYGGYGEYGGYYGYGSDAKA